jgi:hypothetical protein
MNFTLPLLFKGRDGDGLRIKKREHGEAKKAGSIGTGFFIFLIVSLQQF